jgi:hypothetical protein
MRRAKLSTFSSLGKLSAGVLQHLPGLGQRAQGLCRLLNLSDLSDALKVQGTYVRNDANDLSYAEDISFLHFVGQRHSPPWRDVRTEEPGQLARRGWRTMQAVPVHARSA